MSLLSYNQLCELVETNIIDADPKNVNGASIDIRLGDQILLESVSPDVRENPLDPKSRSAMPLVDLSDKKASVNWKTITMGPNGVIIYPNQCFLAHSMEHFKIPYNMCAEFRLRSSIARNLLDASLAMWMNPAWGFEQSVGPVLTLELKNISEGHRLLIKPGLRIGQVIFNQIETVPKEKSYAARGRYNKTLTVQQSFGHG